MEKENLNVQETENEKNDNDNRHSLIIADLIETEANAKLEVITGDSVAGLIFSACSELYMKYSDHKEKFPSYKDFKLYTETNDDNIIIRINAFGKDFDLNITKIDDVYHEMFKSNYLKYEIDDNMVAVTVSFADTKETICEIMPLVIPYAFIETTQGIMGPANTEDFRDLHDTIFGFNLMMNPHCMGVTKCADTDKYDVDTGMYIAKMKALREKTVLDIGNYTTSVQEYEHQIEKYNKLLIAAKRTLRRCKRSNDKLYHKIGLYCK